VQSAATPVGAILVKPTKDLTVYASYISGLQPGSQASQTFNGLSVTNAFAFLPAFVADQYEVGTKYVFNDDLTLAAALFRIEEPNGVYELTNGGTAYNFTQDGKEVHDGVEFSAIGRVTSQLTLYSGVMFLDPKVVKAQTFSGKDPQGVPKVQANGFAEYAITQVPGLSLMGGVFYTGSEFLDQANTMSIPGFATVDVGAKYTTSLYGHPFVSRLYIQNALGANNWVTAEYGQLTLADPRTIKLNVSMDF
jgi:iron complex outermembrane receptor protein